MKLALLATLATAATAFVAPSAPLVTRSPTQIFAEDDAEAAPRSAAEISALPASVKTIFILK